MWPPLVTAWEKPGTVRKDDEDFPSLVGLNQAEAELCPARLEYCFHPPTPSLIIWNFQDQGNLLFVWGKGFSRCSSTEFVD